VTLPRGGEPMFLSSARLTGLRICLPCDRAALASELSRVGPFALRELHDYRAGQHPICCEVWQISDGRMELAGIDQHTWTSRIASAWRGAALWSRRPSLTSSAPVIWATRLSQTLSSTLGNYRELLVSVPEVCLRDAPDCAYNLVLGMVTDSALARWADVAFGFGYHKQAGAFASDDPGHWEVSGHQGQPLLRITTRVGDELSSSVLAAIDGTQSAPLLGGIGMRSHVGSYLSRSLVSARVRARVASGQCELLSDLALGPERGTYDLTSDTESERWCTLAFADVLARVSYPWTLGA
jgi:hypothetical protein